MNKTFLEQMKQYNESEHYIKLSNLPENPCNDYEQTFIELFDSFFKNWENNLKDESKLKFKQQAILSKFVEDSVILDDIKSNGNEDDLEFYFNLLSIFPYIISFIYNHKFENIYPTKLTVSEKRKKDVIFKNESMILFMKLYDNDSNLDEDLTIYGIPYEDIYNLILDVIIPFYFEDTSLDVMEKFLMYSDDFEYDFEEVEKYINRFEEYSSKLFKEFKETKHMEKNYFYDKNGSISKENLQFLMNLKNANTVKKSYTMLIETHKLLEQNPHLEPYKDAIFKSITTIVSKMNNITDDEIVANIYMMFKKYTALTNLNRSNKILSNSIEDSDEFIKTLFIAICKDFTNKELPISEPFNNLNFWKGYIYLLKECSNEI